VDSNRHLAKSPGADEGAASESTAPDVSPRDQDHVAPAPTKHTSDGADNPIHTVERGETLARIAARYNLRLSDLIEWNNLPGAHIQVGQRLRLSRPPDAPATRTASDFEYHFVEVGESLSGIAAAHQVSVTDLRKWNELPDTVIRAGQKLRVRAP
jgi:LysM repeat protein